jgi:hypothetical protein
MDGINSDFYKFIESIAPNRNTVIREIPSTLGGPSCKSVHPQHGGIVTLFL